MQTFPRRPMCLWALPVLLLAAVLLNGCARVVATTELKPDGSWNRKLVFHATVPSDKGMTLGPKPEEIFGFPTAPAWKITRTRKDDELILTAERTMKSGETLPSDLLLKGPKGAARLTNTVTVRQIAPGRWEYRETLHWNGPTPAEMQKMPAEFSTEMRRLLPPALATEENLKSLAQVFLREMWHVIYGPGDPLLSQILMNPDLVERKVIRRIGSALNKALLDRFGEKMTESQRIAVVRELVRKSVEGTQASNKEKADPNKTMNDNPNKGPDATLTSLLFAIKLPGKIVSSNGELDEFTGEVYWSCYTEAAAVGDVTMTAVCDTNK